MLLGDFQLGDLIACGGISEIYRAEHSVFGTPAAVKLLSKDSARSREHQGVLMAEARAHARLRHPQIVELYDCGDTDEPVPRPFLALQLADGNLAQRLPVDGVTEFVEVMTSILRGLMYAHARGFLHRDIKPENILVFDEERTRYKISDFGVALGMRELNVEETLRGTPLYMAPEQVTGRWRLCGPWTDVYAAGVVAWELLTGKPPHDADGLAEMSKIKNAQDPPEFEPLFDVPCALERWTRRMLSRSIHARYAMAADALRGLEEALEDTNVNRQSGEFQKVDRSQVEAIQTLLDAPPVLVDSSPGIQVPQVLVYDPPGLPEDWVEVDERTVGQSIGLGLFALRPLPFVGHESQRDELWQMLTRVSQGEGLRCVWVESEINSEAGEMVEWFSDEVSESGAARVFRLNHTRERGPMDGFIGALVEHFSAAGLSNQSVREHLANRLGWNESSCAESDLRVLASEMSIEREGSESDLERHRVLARFFVRLCSERPVVILIENAQWGLDALNFVGMMQRTFSHLPILFVPVVNRLLADESSLEMVAIQRLAEHQMAHRIELEPPTVHDHRKRIDLMLEMTDDLASEIAEITVPDASWSSLLITEIIERDQLEASRDGYALKKGYELPRTLPELIHSRLETLSSEEAIQALEIAAILGLAPSSLELDSALRAAGIELAAEDIQRFSDAGLIQLGESWRFTHYTILEVLRERSRAHGRWREQNVICATVMDQEPKSSNVAYNYAMRLGWHAQQGERPELAIEELQRVVLQSCRAMPELGTRCLDLREKLVQILGDERREYEMLRQSLLRATILLSQGQVETARGLALDALHLARTRGHHMEVVHALRIMGREAIDRGDFEAGIRFLEEGRVNAREMHQWETLGGIEVNLGWAQFCQSQFDASLSHYDSARQCFAKVPGLLAAEPETFAAITYIAMDELELAREHTSRALNRIRKSRDLSLLPEVVNNLAEIARFEGRWEDAHRYVEATAWWRSLTGHRFTHVDDFNRGLVAIGARRFGDARHFLAGLNERYVDAGLHSRLGLVYAAQAAMTLAWGDEKEAGVKLDCLDAFIALNGVTHRDIGWSCERGFELARDAAQPDLERRFGEFAASQYKQIGLVHRASAIEAKLRKPKESTEGGVIR